MISTLMSQLNPSTSARTTNVSAPRIAFQGERGAFSEQAALQLLGANIKLVPRLTFDTLFTSIAEGLADYILAPLENSLAGSVHRTYDLLVESDLQITAEVVIPIAHHLIGCPGATFEQITTVESHPVALAQCERFFNQFPEIKRLATEDTAGSVAEITESGDQTRAAIAGARAADVYGGIILREHLEDHSENYTRFVLLSSEPHVHERTNKLSLAFKLQHLPAALHRALAPFAHRQINLLKIESRPVKGLPWQYRFYVDLEASVNDAEVVVALDELRSCADEVRLLGCYKAHEF
ncbi:MAG TPA: prephenate dehydratase [Pyrinomonadaceae bacterium]|nr:prephenate dehydratase [Pyrinomonadaceae bacterium]